jgi:hypothetical protein
LNLVDDELVSAACGINVDCATADDLQPVVQVKPQAAGGAPPDDGADLGAIVLEGQINVTRLGTREVAHLAGHGNLGKAPFQLRLDLVRKLRDRENPLSLGFFRE